MFSSTLAIEVPAKSARAIRVAAGQFVKVIDVEGAQVSDMFACCADDPSDWLSTGHTRTRTARLFPRLGQAFYTRSYRPILTFVADTSPGAHDMLYPCCCPIMYRRLGAAAGHPNCKDNFKRAAAAAGWRPPVTPDPVNLFQNTPATEDGDLLIQSAVSRPGDAVVFRAEMDVIFLVTACAQDLAAINGDHCTRIRVEVSDAAP
jgi:uncharacterized protein